MNKTYIVIHVDGTVERGEATCAELGKTIKAVRGDEFGNLFADECYTIPYQTLRHLNGDKCLEYVSIVNNDATCEEQGTIPCGIDMVIDEESALVDKPALNIVASMVATMSRMKHAGVKDPKREDVDKYFVSIYGDALIVGRLECHTVYLSDGQADATMGLIDIILSDIKKSAIQKTRKETNNEL